MTWSLALLSVTVPSGGSVLLTLLFPSDTGPVSGGCPRLEMSLKIRSPDGRLPDGLALLLRAAFPGTLTPDVAFC